MNAFNQMATSVCDVLFAPLQWLGPYGPLLVFSAAFTAFALWIFKHISWQHAIKRTKDRIKGNLIEIRIYQDDLAVVGKAVGVILVRNFQYLFMNFGPILPLLIPGAVLLAQFVVRYAYAPLPVESAADSAGGVLPGRGTLVEIELARGHESEIGQLALNLPEGLRAVGPLARPRSSGGRAFQEIVAVAPGEHSLELVLTCGDGTTVREKKLVVAGESPARVMQPRRVSANEWYRLHDVEHCALLWPGEPAFAADSPFRSVAISYPSRKIPWLPDGEVGMLATFFIVCMGFGALLIKPLGVQI